MGISPAALAGLPRLRQAEVTLNVYDLSTCDQVKALNKALRVLGTGAFHCGIEVYSWEWSYDSEGIFCCKPRLCQEHNYSESLMMGKSKMSEDEVLMAIQYLSKVWRGEDYNVLNHNCCHFSDHFCRCLGVALLPAWVLNLAGAGDSIMKTGREVANRAAHHASCGTTTTASCC
mmetsp:Transcript_88081/g.285083  ORF Transcript_88081/g.285083 Transcript_88081/m.285083 type:complete len:174 (+) Transcript_88081:60-581(+)